MVQLTIIAIEFNIAPSNPINALPFTFCNTTKPGSEISLCFFATCYDHYTISSRALLVDPCRCSKVYMTPICAANSPLLERDLKRSTLSREIRHARGDMQDSCTAYKAGRDRLYWTYDVTPKTFLTLCRPFP
ncbi:hypothetical protein G6F37_000856 [Rhizopus arrhizus]|nr:hypothetical protein G6F38_004236 [Rhizopus arrhizus]KAG1163821.1 hypothetical protein G6F37_000856 [Rhizopus arrhizus]